MPFYIAECVDPSDLKVSTVRRSEMDVADGIAKDVGELAEYAVSRMDGKQLTELEHRILGRRRILAKRTTPGRR